MKDGGQSHPAACAHRDGAGAHCEEFLFSGQDAACGGADVAESAVLLACPRGPVPLAARGLTAVLAAGRPGGRSWLSPAGRAAAAGA